jgi:hypothetical protein
MRAHAGNGVTPAYRSSALLGRGRYLWGVARRTGVGGARQHGVVGWVVERVVQPGNHAGRVAEGWMRREVLDLFAVYPDVTRAA